MKKISMMNTTSSMGVRSICCLIGRLLLVFLSAHLTWLYQ